MSDDDAGARLDLSALRGALVTWITDGRARQATVADLPGFLDRTDGFVWLDLPRCHTDSAVVLESLLGFQPIALRDARRRNYVPKVLAFPDHTFLVLHSVESEAGEVQLLELDQFVGPRYLVTVHGPMPPGVEPEAAFRDVAAVRSLLTTGELRPASPLELSYALVSSLVSRQDEAVTDLAGRADVLERRVRAAGPSEIERLLDDLYTLRNRFLSLRLVAARSADAYRRWVELTAIPADLLPVAEDVTASFVRLQSLCDEEREILHALTEFHEARVATKMNVAMERLALISAVLLPITAIASIYGMNVIVSGSTRPMHLALVLIFMAAVSFFILRWTKRQGWW